MLFFENTVSNTEGKKRKQTGTDFKKLCKRQGNLFYLQPCVDILGSNNMPDFVLR